MSRHLKSYAAPKSWTILRKVNKWILKPGAGAHPLKMALPIGILLKQLGCAKTTREAKKIVNSKAVLVDGKTVKDVHRGVGFMDIVQVKPDIAIRCILDEKGRLQFKPTTQTETNRKICKITRKNTVKGRKLQFTLSDGRNILNEKDNYAVGDSLVIEIPSQKVVQHIPLSKGHLAFIIDGRHTGTLGTITDIKENKIWCTKDKKKIETLKQFAFVVGTDKPAIKL